MAIINSHWIFWFERHAAVLVSTLFCRGSGIKHEFGIIPFLLSISANRLARVKRMMRSRCLVRLNKSTNMIFRINLPVVNSNWRVLNLKRYKCSYHWNQLQMEHSARHSTKHPIHLHRWILMTHSNLAMLLIWRRHCRWFKIISSHARYIAVTKPFD